MSAGAASQIRIPCRIGVGVLPLVVAASALASAVRHEPVLWVVSAVIGILLVGARQGGRAGSVARQVGRQSTGDGPRGPRAAVGTAGGAGAGR